MKKAVKFGWGMVGAVALLDGVKDAKDRVD